MKITQPIQKTQEEEFKDFLEMFQGLLSSMYAHIDNQHRELFKMFWNSQYDPQKIADALGFEKSLALFQLSAGLQDILQAGDSDYERLITPKDVDFSTGKVVIKGNLL